MNRNDRPDHQPGHRKEYERHRQRILLTETICGICGQPVDKRLKYPHPYSPTIDHIIPISRGGHPTDINNLQLAHMTCNRAKANKLMLENRTGKNILSSGSVPPVINSPLGFFSSPGDLYGTPRGLPFTLDWPSYRYNEEEDKSNSEELLLKAEDMRKQGFIMTAKGVIKI